MRDVPISVFLQFPPANYNHPHTRGPALLIVNAIFTAIVVAVVSLRLYTRIFIKRWVGADDYFILIAAVFTLGLTATVVLANCRYQWDRHIYDIPFSKFPSLGKIAMAAKALFSAATFFTRVSLLCFYYRLIRDTNLNKYRWALHVAGIFNFMVFISFLFLSIFLCTPIAAYWIFPASGKCLDEGKVTLAAGIINCVLDLLITSLPIPMVMRLQMRPRQRAGVVVLLSLGFVVTIAGIVRTYFIWLSLIKSYDETWLSYPLWIAAAVEVDLAVITACAPSLRPFLLKHFRPLITSLSGTRSRDQNKHDGYVSAQSGPSSTEATYDEKTFEEKIPVARLAKSPVNERMTIMQQQSWEVSSGPLTKEDQAQMRHSPYDDEYHIGVAISSQSDQERHERARRARSQSIDLVEATRRYENSAPPKTLSPKPSSPFTWTESEMARNRTGTLDASTKEGNLSRQSNLELTSEQSQEHLRPESKPVLQERERKWVIDNNPFRENSPAEYNGGSASRQRAGEELRGVEMKVLGRSRSLQKRDFRNWR